MKKIFNFAMMGAIALTGAMTFTACSSDDEAQAPVNPTYDGESVKTTFSISVGDVKSATRMTAKSAQTDEKFQGMTDIYLFPAKEAIVANTPFSEGYLNLPSFASSEFEMDNAKGKIYKNVSFSVGVNNFLFYAAIADANKGIGELKPSYLKVAKEQFNGNLDWNAKAIKTTTTPADLTFDLVPWQKDKTIAFVQDKGKGGVVDTLNHVVAELSNQLNTATDANATDAIKNTLQTKLDSITNKVQGTYTAFGGSAANIKALLEDFYNGLKVLTGDITTYTNPIVTVIEDKFDESGDATSGYTLAWPNGASTDVTEFPKALNLPDGAVAIKYNATSKVFEYTDDVNIQGLTSPTISTYTRPARLYYTINSPAAVKDQVWLNNNTAAANWTSVVSEYETGAIKATTQSVIMQEQVQYAVARLDVAVRVNPDVTILDSGSGITGAADAAPQPVVVPNEGYTLTGVLIGGQKQVNWKFEPIGSEEQTIWDNDMTAAIAAQATSGYSANKNSTLALETAASTPVNVALEFVNTGNDFYGYQHKLIPHGCKFYLIAKLTPGTNEISNSDALTQVFKQDYTTTANLTIGEKSLQKAYNTIPDLRSPKLEFGLSVDLHWRTGITFQQEFE